jgi:hypothetical protein
VIEYLVLKGNYMLSKHADYEPLPKAIEKVMVLMSVNVLSTGISGTLSNEARLSYLLVISFQTVHTHLHPRTDSSLGTK